MCLEISGLGHLEKLDSIALHFLRSRHHLGQASPLGLVGTCRSNLFLKIPGWYLACMVKFAALRTWNGSSFFDRSLTPRAGASTHYIQDTDILSLAVPFFCLPMHLLVQPAL